MMFLSTSKNELYLQCTGSFICCLGKKIFSQNYHGISQTFIWDHSHRCGIILSCPIGKKLVKKGWIWAENFFGAVHKWYPILGRGGRFSKIGESLCKKAFSIGGKSEIGGRGGQKWPQKIGYHLWTAPNENFFRQEDTHVFQRLKESFENLH